MEMTCDANHTLSDAKTRLGSGRGRRLLHWISNLLACYFPYLLDLLHCTVWLSIRRRPRLAPKRNRSKRNRPAVAAFADWHCGGNVRSVLR